MSVLFFMPISVKDLVLSCINHTWLIFHSSWASEVTQGSDIFCSSSSSAQNVGDAHHSICNRRFCHIHRTTQFTCLSSSARPASISPFSKLTPSFGCCSGQVCASAYTHTPTMISNTLVEATPQCNVFYSPGPSAKNSDSCCGKSSKAGIQLLMTKPAHWFLSPPCSPT